MPRKVRITTTSFNFPGTRTVAQNREQARSFVEAAGAEGADLVCLAENFLQTGRPRAERPIAEPVPGETADALAAAARRHKLWVIAGFTVQLEDGSVENSALVFNRDGDLAGRYSKVYPTIGECRTTGITPGAAPGIVDTDFGRLGLAICFDVGYPEYWRRLKEEGAELVVWPSAYDGGFSLQSYAWTHGYHIVSAVRTPHAKVIDISGQVLASTSRWHRLVTTTIDLEKELFHVAVCLGQHERLFRLQEELGPRVTVRGFSEEHVVTVESNDPEWPLARIKERYGLLNFDEYHEASRVVHAEYRRRELAPALA